jgi:hypothetical protein
MHKCVKTVWVDARKAYIAPPDVTSSTMSCLCAVQGIITTEQANRQDYNATTSWRRPWHWQVLKAFPPISHRLRQCNDDKFEMQRHLMTPSWEVHKQDKNQDDQWHLYYVKTRSGAPPHAEIFEERKFPAPSESRDGISQWIINTLR